MPTVCPDNQFRMSILERLEQMERRMAEMASHQQPSSAGSGGAGGGAGGGGGGGGGGAGGGANSQSQVRRVERTQNNCLVVQYVLVRQRISEHFLLLLRRLNGRQLMYELILCVHEVVSGQLQPSSSFESRVVVVCEKMMSRACWAKSKHLIHSKTFRGMTLLHLAAGQGYATLIQTLIKWR